MPDLAIPDPGPLLDYGLVGIILFLIIRGWLAPKPTIDQLKSEVAYLRKLLAQSEAAHEKTREARHLEAAGANAAALATARANEVLLTDLRDLHGDPEEPT
ncbi:hypothetical protein ACLQ2R_03120 [Streptosporangium sp. DT93]|uniref:hypothetical protein n=1 Tax=Streptosporangium sp. DT93 TaxID=3393428 RepID=UPI003CEBEA8E